jgi:NIPSNAP
MHRREVLAGIAASLVTTSSAQSQPAEAPNTYLELKTWRLHNSEENQAARVADYLQAGLSPALSRAGAKLAGAFSNVIGEEGPYYVTLIEYPSLKAFQDVLSAVHSDPEHERELEKLSSGSGMPFVRVESSLLRSFDHMPKIAYPDASEKRPPRIFELRTYESQSFLTLRRKVAMFNNGEAQIFERLGMRPVFFGETIAGPKQPNLNYMLSYDDLAARDNLWHAFGSDPEWKKLSGQPQLKDAEIVANISNAILRPLTFSPIR